MICRLCGIDIRPIGYPPRTYVIDELCCRCNEHYNAYYRRRMGIRLWTDVGRNELILTEYVADRLRQLAKRYQDGKSIMRCDVESGWDRCFFFSSEEIEGHKLCKVHAKIYRAGRKRLRFANANAEWFDQVTKFFRDNWTSHD